MRTISGVGRIAAVAAVVVAVGVVAWLLFGGAGGGYEVKADFINANQLVKGNQVLIDGVPVGKVTNLDVTQNGQAVVTMKIDGDHAPLRKGTIAEVHQASQSGIANRYVLLRLPSGEHKSSIPDGGTLSVDETKTSVDLDQLFNTLNPPTRKALQDFIKGQAAAVQGRGAQQNRGFHYLSASLSTSRRLFEEVNSDTARLTRFLVDSSRLVTTLAQRRDHLSALISNLNRMMGAIGANKAALAEALQRLPGFMRRANTTFVNLRSTLDVVDPWVNASKPVAKKLQVFLPLARGFAHDAKPTIHNLNQIVRRRGANNDLYDLTKTYGPLASAALDTKNRKVNAGGGPRSVGKTKGAFPQNVDALNSSKPIIAFGRSYTPELFGWFDDFSTTGSYDALGGISRTQVIFDGLTIENAIPQLVPSNQERAALYQQQVKPGQYRRCPGASEAPAPDGSNVFSADQQRALDCTEADRAVTK
jgi:phospholipid/cholesterol/gamma-HCH transport system substrate-binding protein